MRINENVLGGAFMNIMDESKKTVNAVRREFGRVFGRSVLDRLTVKRDTVCRCAFVFGHGGDGFRVSLSVIVIGGESDTRSGDVEFLIVFDGSGGNRPYESAQKDMRGRFGRKFSKPEWENTYYSSEKDGMCLDTGADRIGDVLDFMKSCLDRIGEPEIRPA